MAQLYQQTLTPASNEISLTLRNNNYIELKELIGTSVGERWRHDIVKEGYDERDMKFCGRRPVTRLRD